MTDKPFVTEMKFIFNIIHASLWHKVDIRIFLCHKDVNFCDNLVGLVISDDQKSKIWKVNGNIFFLNPLIRV